MKNLKLGAAMLLCAVLLIAAVPTEAEAEIYEDTLRLHILAASDSKEDQALKYEIRDEILRKYGSILSEADSPEGAAMLAEELLSKIEKDTAMWLSERGYAYPVSATLTEEWYDTREYEDFTLPAGYYKSLRIIIDGGEGKNWWCVMYPPLCMNLATESAPADDGIIDYTKEEVTLIKSGKYNVKFKILEVAAKAFRKK